MCDLNYGQRLWRTTAKIRGSNDVLQELQGVYANGIIDVFVTDVTDEKLAQVKQLGLESYLTHYGKVVLMDHTGIRIKVQQPAQYDERHIPFENVTNVLIGRRAIFDDFSTLTVPKGNITNKV